MAAELLLVNPRRKRSRKHRRKMSALQRQYFGKRRKVTAIASNPRRRRRRKVRRSTLFSNPRRRRRVRRLFSNPRRRRRTRRLYRNPRPRLRLLRRNPLPNSMKGYDTALMNAGIGAVGAIGADWLMANFIMRNFPQLSQGMMYVLTKLGLAIGVGYIAGELGGSAMGEEAMAGAMTVTVYNLGRSYMALNMPNVQLAGTGRYMRGMGFIARRRRMGRYMKGVGTMRFRGMGYINPTPTMSGMARYLGHP